MFEKLKDPFIRYVGQGHYVVAIYNLLISQYIKYQVYKSLQRKKTSAISIMCPSDLLNVDDTYEYIIYKNNKVYLYSRTTIMNGYFEQCSKSKTHLSELTPGSLNCTIRMTPVEDTNLLHSFRSLPNPKEQKTVEYDSLALPKDHPMNILFSLSYVHRSKKALIFSYFKDSLWYINQCPYTSIGIISGLFPHKHTFQSFKVEFCLANYRIIEAPSYCCNSPYFIHQLIYEDQITMSYSEFIKDLQTHQLPRRLSNWSSSGPSAVRTLTGP